MHSNLYYKLHIPTIDAHIFTFLNLGLKNKFQNKKQENPREK